MHNKVVSFNIKLYHFETGLLNKMVEHAGMVSV